MAVPTSAARFVDVILIDAYADIQKVDTDAQIAFDALERGEDGVSLSFLERHEETMFAVQGRFLEAITSLQEKLKDAAAKPTSDNSNIFFEARVESPPSAYSEEGSRKTVCDSLFRQFRQKIEAISKGHQERANIVWASCQRRPLANHPRLVQGFQPKPGASLKDSLHEAINSFCDELTKAVQDNSIFAPVRSLLAAPSPAPAATLHSDLPTS